MGVPAPLLERLCGQAMSLGSQSIEVEYKDVREWVFACQGAMGVGIASYTISGAHAKQLRRGPYAAARKRLRTVVLGKDIVLSVRVFDSFGEDAFEVTMASEPRPGPSKIARL